MEIQRKISINVDFDGTVVTHSFPEIGKEIGAVPVLKKLIENGHQLILFTMRCDHDKQPTGNDPSIQYIVGNFLTDAVNWFKKHNIPLYGIQRNPTQDTWTSSPKSYAQLMIDDSALVAPLMSIPELSDRPFINWLEVTTWLYRQDLISKEDYEEIYHEIFSFFSYTYDIDLYNVY